MNFTDIFMDDNNYEFLDTVFFRIMIYVDFFMDIV